MTIRSTDTDVLDQAELDLTFDTGRVSVVLRLTGRLDARVPDTPEAVAMHVRAGLEGRERSESLAVEIFTGPGEDAVGLDDA